MEIKSVSSLFFGGAANGIVLDNAYDQYNRNRYIEYVATNKVNFIRSQDTDMSMLEAFPDLEFLTIPEEAQNLQSVYNLQQLKGVEISAATFDFLDIEKLENVQILVIHGHPKRIGNLALNKSIKKLYISQWDIIDFSVFKELSQVEFLGAIFCGRLKTVNGIDCFKNLKSLSLEYCLKLEDVAPLKMDSSSLQELSIVDCNKIKDFAVLKDLKALRKLSLATFETQKKNQIPSIKFMEKLPCLEEFVTNYKVGDDDLKPLLRLKNVELLAYYQSYNLRQDKLPTRNN